MKRTDIRKNKDGDWKVREPMKRTAIKPKRSLSNSLSVQWAKCVKARDKGCKMAGMLGITCSETLEAHHIKGRFYKALKHDPDNGLTLCNNHHRWVTDHHKEANKLIEQIVGHEWWLYLDSESCRCVPVRIDTKEQMALLVELTKNYESLP